MTWSATSSSAAEAVSAAGKTAASRGRVVVRPAELSDTSADEHAIVGMTQGNWLTLPEFMPAEALEWGELAKLRRERRQAAAAHPLGPAAFLFVVAVDEASGSVVGFLDAGPPLGHREELERAGVDPGKAVELLSLHVHPDHNRRGIGGLLFDHFKAWVPTCASVVAPEAPPGEIPVVLWTWVGNFRSIPFYTARGGEIVLRTSWPYLGHDVSVLLFAWRGGLGV